MDPTVRRQECIGTILNSQSNRQGPLFAAVKREDKDMLPGTMHSRTTQTIQEIDAGDLQQLKAEEQELQKQEHEPRKIAINPDKFDKLITSLRTAVDNDGTLDKESTSYNDIFDAFRLALKFYSFREKDA